MIGDSLKPRFSRRLGRLPRAPLDLLTTADHDVAESDQSQVDPAPTVDPVDPATPREQYVGTGTGSDAIAPWMMFPLSYMADREAAAGVEQTYEFRIDKEYFHLIVAGGRVEPTSGPAPTADVVFTMSTNTFRSLFEGRTTPQDAIGAWGLEVEGEPEAIGTCLAILSPRPVPGDDR